MGFEAKIAAGESLDNVKVLCVGDKSRAFFQRFFPKQILMVGSEIGRLPPTFNDASKVANAILTSGYDFDEGKLLFNYYKSVVSNETLEIPIYSQDLIASSEKVSVYDSLDADVVQSYLEYSLASLVYYCMKEGATSEQSSRMSAMDNSSKNAGEMIDKLTSPSTELDRLSSPESLLKLFLVPLLSKTKNCDQAVQETSFLQFSDLCFPHCIPRATNLV